MNAINVIAPYRHHGMWVFDDPRVGLVQEPFVAGADAMIDRVVADIPDAEGGFTMIFSGAPFPGHQYQLEWRREEGGGNWYYARNWTWRAGSVLRCSGIFRRLRNGSSSRRKPAVLRARRVAPKFDMARRLAIFALLGPALGFALGFAMLLLAAILSGARLDGGIVPFLGWAYLIGIVPAILAGLADNVLAGAVPQPLRSVLVGIVGCFASALSAAVAISAQEMVMLLVGILGLAPAIVCSWIAGWGSEPSFPGRDRAGPPADLR